MLTGCHGLHVAARSSYGSPRYFFVLFVKGEDWHDPELIEVAGIYWHFVDVVWIIIFPVVYLFRLRIDGSIYVIRYSSASLTCKVLLASLC